jgi:hypothetical protein
MLAEHYRNAHVRTRLIEFLGGDSPANTTSVYMTASGGDQPAWHEPMLVRNIVQYLGDGIEVARSLWDRESLIADIDIEYVNFDVPSESYLEPIRTFGVQQPVIQAIQETLASFGIVPLHILSGRGHHFVWRIRRDSPAFAVLAWIGHVPDTLVGRYAQRQLPVGEIVAPELGAAYAGLGLVMEFIAHRILEISGGRSEIPVELTAVEAGPRSHGREVVSIDLSEYGDPLHTRTLRMPFSAYLKSQPLLPCLFPIPLHEMDLFRGLLVMRDMGAVKELAQISSVAIPDQSAGTEKIIWAYRQSRLASFHREFYATEHDRPEIWTETYDRTDAQLSGDLSTVVHKLSGHLWMVHASDNRGQYDDHLPPGEGSIAWEAVIAQLQRAHFAGAMILEIAGNSDIDAILVRARQSGHFLWEVSSRLGAPKSAHTQAASPDV